MTNWQTASRGKINHPTAVLKAADHCELKSIQLERDSAWQWAQSSSHLALQLWNDKWCSQSDMAKQQAASYSLSSHIYWYNMSGSSATKFVLTSFLFCKYLQNHDGCGTVSVSKNFVASLAHSRSILYNGWVGFCKIRYILKCSEMVLNKMLLSYNNWPLCRTSKMTTKAFRLQGESVRTDSPFETSFPRISTRWSFSSGFYYCGSKLWNRI